MLFFDSFGKILFFLKEFTGKNHMLTGSQFIREKIRARAVSMPAGRIMQGNLVLFAPLRGYQMVSLDHISFDKRKILVTPTPDTILQSLCFYLFIGKILACFCLVIALFIPPSYTLLLVKQVKENGNNMFAAWQFNMVSWTMRRSDFASCSGQM